MIENLSSYRILWLFVFFDLPVASKPERRAATRFRNHLLDMGFDMSQFSVYVKWFDGYDSIDPAINNIRNNIPSAGKVHILTITDKQFEKMITFLGSIERNDKKMPEQFELF